jgi:glucose-6-phosphate isomerase
MKRYQDPKWVASQAISLDYNFAMSELVGDRGLAPAALHGLGPRLEALDLELARERQQGRLGFFQLPFETNLLSELHRVSKPILEWCWHLVVLGTDGAALGARALHQALCPPQHNLLPMARRHHRLALWAADSLDPDFLHGLLDGLDLRRTAFNVINDATDRAEALAQFLWIYGLMRGRLGDRARDLFIVTCGVPGALESLIAREGFPALSHPPGVQGGFSVLAAAGLLPASLLGIDLEELLAGARYLDTRLRSAGPRANLAYRLAALFYLFATLQTRPALVIMPQAMALQGLAAWFCKLWDESLGQCLDRAEAPVSASGAADPALAGPGGKLVTFLEVANFQHHLELPELFPDVEELHYLAGHSLNELFQAQSRAAAFHLLQAGCPSLTLRLPALNPFTIGQLIYLLEVVTVAAAALFGAEPGAPGALAGSRPYAYGLWGRPGFEAFSREMAAAPAPLEKYILT